MEALANVNQFGVIELREDELMEVDGGDGITWAIAIGVALATATYVKTCIDIGKDLGRALYKVTH